MEPVGPPLFGGHIHGGGETNHRTASRIDIFF